MKKIFIFYTIFLALLACQLQAMERPFSPLSLPLTPLQSQFEFDRQDLEELAKMVDIEPEEATALPLPPVSLKRVATEALAIPAAAQVSTEIPQTNKRKKGAELHQCQAPGCNHTDTLFKLRNHILITHVNYRLVCPKKGCNKKYKHQTGLLGHLRKAHSGQPELELQVEELSIEKLNELTDHFIPKSVKANYQCDLCGRSCESKSGLSFHRRRHETHATSKGPAEGKTSIIPPIQESCDRLAGSAAIDLQEPSEQLDANKVAIPAAAQERSLIAKTDQRKETDDSQEVGIRQRYQCQADNCNFKGEVTNLRNHILAKHVKHRYMCPQPDCINKKFSTIRYLKVHLKERHAGSFLLPFPELSQTEIQQLTSRFMPQLHYQCRLCDQSLATYRGLCRHLRAEHNNFTIPKNVSEGEMGSAQSSNSL